MIIFIESIMCLHVSRVRGDNYKGPTQGLPGSKSTPIRLHWRSGGRLRPGLVLTTPRVERLSLGLSFPEAVVVIFKPVLYAVRRSIRIYVAIPSRALIRPNVII